MQLTAFAILAVVGIVTTAVTVLHVPAMLGIGVVRVTAEMDVAAGLYQNANVTYRGKTVGRVESVELDPSRVRARLRIDSGAQIPADATVYVRSMSAVGEQYVDFVPDDHGAAGPALRDGDVVHVDARNQPVPIGPLLDEANAMLAGLPEGQIRTLLDEAFRAFAGGEDDFRVLLDSAHTFVRAAEEKLPETQQLLDEAAPLLDTQRATADEIRSWTSSLVTVTRRLNDSDATIRHVLETAPPTAATVSGLFRDVQPTLPILLSQLVSTTGLLETYNPGLQQLLVLLPPLQAAQLTVMNGARDVGAANVDFYLQANAPPACTTGYLPASQRRSPADLSVPDTPDDLYCKIPQDSKELVRGVRNYPCMEFPGKRAPTPELCRDPEGFQPIGTNPPFGNPNPGAEPGSSSYEGVPVATYDAGTGEYAGADGTVYRTSPAADAAPTLQNLMAPGE
nr:MlaD family protein [Rhodococcus sp. HNM0569]